jgi:cell wall-associated NlpC family hydrolase
MSIQQKSALRSSPSAVAWIGVAVVLVFMALMLGCSSSSPRFRGAPGGATGVVQEDDEFRFASKIKQEETTEDDRKIDVLKLKKELAGKRPTSSQYKNQTPKGLNRDEVLLNAVTYLGVPYEFGGFTKQGIDCSGFTAQVYAGLKKTLPHSTMEQFHAGKEIASDELQIGDLVFFNTTGRSPSHVGMYIEDDLFMHASLAYGVTISSLESSYYKKRFVGARRVVE